MLTKDQIEAKIAELTKARDLFTAQAERQIANIQGRIEAYKEMLAEPKEPDVVLDMKKMAPKRATAQ
jgi:hypothetical protein